MSYHADKQVIDTHTHTDRYTDRGDDNTRRPKLASGKNLLQTNYYSGARQATYVW